MSDIEEFSSTIAASRVSHFAISSSANEEEHKALPVPLRNCAPPSGNGASRQAICRRKRLPRRVSLRLSLAAARSRCLVRHTEGPACALLGGPAPASGYVTGTPRVRARTGARTCQMQGGGICENQSIELSSLPIGRSRARASQFLGNGRAHLARPQSASALCNQTECFSSTAAVPTHPPTNSHTRTHTGAGPQLPDRP